MKDKIKQFRKASRDFYKFDIYPNINKILKYVIWSSLSIIALVLVITEGVWDAQYSGIRWGGNGGEALAVFGIAFAALGLITLIAGFYYGRLRNWKFGRTITTLLMAAAILFIIAASVSAKYQREAWHDFHRVSSTKGWTSEQLRRYKAQQVYPAIVVILAVFAPLGGVAAFWYAWRNGAIKKVMEEHKADYYSHHEISERYKTRQIDLDRKKRSVEDDK